MFSYKLEIGRSYMYYRSSSQALNFLKVKLVEFLKPKFVTPVWVTKYEGEALYEKFWSDEMKVRER
jgi:hypothetical protein